MPSDGALLRGTPSPHRLKPRSWPPLTLTKAGGPKGKNRCDVVESYGDCPVRFSLVLREQDVLLPERRLGGETLWFPLYRWGQDVSEFNNTQPVVGGGVLALLLAELERRGHGRFNHSIGIGYYEKASKAAPGCISRQHSPPHRDKQAGQTPSAPKFEDMRASSSFVVLSVHTPDCTPRVFQLYRYPLNWDVDVRSQLVWEARLPHGSMLVVSALANNDCLHCVPLIGKADKADKSSGAITISRERAAAVSEQGQGPDGKPCAPPGCVYEPTFLAPDAADKLLAWCQAQPVEEVVMQRTLALKRAPKFVHVVQYVGDEQKLRRETREAALKRWYEEGAVVEWDTEV